MKNIGLKVLVCGFLSLNAAYAATGVEYVCSGASGYELIYSKGAERTINNVDIRKDEMQYVFSLSKDQKHISLSIRKTGVVEPSRRGHDLVLIENSSKRIVAMDSVDDPVWLYVIYPQQKSVMYMSATSSLRFEEVRGLMFLSSCEIK